MLAAVMKTADGRHKVYIYADQTAELRGERGVLIAGRRTLGKIGAVLAEMGIDSADLVPA